jgi:signal transduction histidine kinase
MASSSLKRRFLLSTIAIYLATAFASYAALAWIADGIVVQLGTGFAERQVQLSRTQCLAPLLREVALARKMADSPLLRQWAAAENDHGLRKQSLAEMESYRRSFRDGSYFFALENSGHYYFNDAKGKYSGQELRYTLDPAKPADGWFFATLKGDSDYQINVNPDEHLQVTKVWINVLMREGGRVLGVVGTGIDLSTFIGDVVESNQAGTTNVFVDANGAIQAHKQVGLIDFASLTKAASEHATIYNLIDDESGRHALAESMQRLEHADGGVETLFLSVGGRRHLVGVAYLKEIRWFAITLIDLDVLMQQGRFLSVAILFGLALLVALFSIAVLLDRVVLARVSRLNASARDIAAGDYSVQLAAGADDEIGRLARNFQHMAEKVRHHTETLEQTVQATAAKYEDANRMLEDQTRELTRANSELEQFAYVASHDLRQPLRMVSSYLSLIERRLGAALDDEAKTFIGFAIRGAKRMDQLILDLLDYSRTGRDSKPSEPVALGDAVSDSLQILTAAIADAGAEVVVPDTLPTVMGYRGELTRLFQNLIGNAVKYRAADRRSRVEISCHKAGGEWEIAVADNGIGIATDGLERAFGVFQRLVPADAYEGTGIGLSVCKKIVEHHGGRIWIESELGSGSVIRFTLPRAI